MKKFLEFLKENLDLRNIDNLEIITASLTLANIFVAFERILPKPFNFLLVFIFSLIFVYCLNSELKQERDFENKEIYLIEQEKVVILGRNFRTESEKIFCVILYSVFLLISYYFIIFSTILLAPLIIYEIFLNKKFRKNKSENK